MVALLRHRQTKEADNSYARPNATAPHLDSTAYSHWLGAGQTAGVGRQLL